MADTKYKIGVEITGDDSKFRASAKASEKAVSDLEKKASGDFKKIASNFAGIFSDKAKDTGLGKFVGDVTSGTGALDKFLGPATLVSGAIVGIGSAAIATGVSLVTMAKSASDYSGDISDASQKTGLAIDTISSMKFAGEAFGASFEEMTGAATKFTKLVGESARGNEEAKKTLIALGVDPKKAINDLDGAMAQVMKRIYELPPGTQQVNAAIAAFGKSGANVIPVLNAFEGDLGALKKRASELGLVLTDEAIKAGDDFGDMFEIVTAQVKANASAIALGWAPEIKDGMADVSRYLADNKDDWKRWGENVGTMIRGVRAAFSSETAGMIKDGANLWFKYSPDPVTSLFRGANNLGYSTGKYLMQQGVIDGNKNPAASPTGWNGLNKFLDNASREAEADRKRKAFMANLGIDVDDFLGETGGSASGKKKKDSLTEAQKTTWSSSTLAEFARNNGFAVNPANGSGAATGGHNPNSLHYVKKAFDVGLGATNPNKTVEQIVSYMENAIKAGIRVVDERVRPKKGAKWSAPHIHTEENDSKASFFNPNLDYGGRLEYLKALDAERLKGKGQSMAEALGTVRKELTPAEKALADYDNQLKLLGVTTERGRLEVDLQNKAYGKLTDAQTEQLRLNADIIDDFEKQSKASDEYSSFLEKMTGEYNDLKGIVPTNTELLDKQLQSLSDAGVVLDATAEAYARNVALMLDMQSAGDKLDESIAGNIASYKAERDAAWDLVLAHQEVKNAIARETGGREQSAGGIVSGAVLPTDDGAAAPKIKRKSSAYGIADGASRGEFKKGGIFDQDTVDTQVSMMGTLKDAGMDAFGAISQEIANATANWIAFGDASGQTLGEVTANVLASVSSQALAMGLMELGIGIAALTPWGAAIYGPAPIHFKSAAVLMGIGAAFGGAARIAGSASGGGKSSSGNDSKQNPSEYFSNNSDDRNINYLRRSQNSQADRQNMILGDKINQFVSAVETFEKKVNSTKAGDVFVAGIKQNPGLTADTVTKELGRNSTAASRLGRRLPSK